MDGSHGTFLSLFRGIPVHDSDIAWGLVLAMSFLPFSH